MDYDSIINRKTAIRPAITLRSWDDVNHSWSTYTVPAVTWKTPPPSQVCSYNPDPQILKYRIDPSKGRNFTKLRDQGLILVSPLHVVNITTQDFLAASDHVFKGHGFQQSSGLYYGSPTCFDYVDTSPYLDCRWTEQGDFRYWSTRLPSKMFVLNEIEQSLISDAIASTQQQAMSDALQGYDLLSELGELKETLSFILGNIGSAAASLRSFRDKDPSNFSKGRNSRPVDLIRSSDKGLQTLGRRWMEYRYALMPIIYSIRDIMKASEGDLIWKTSRAKEVLKPSRRLSDVIPIATNDVCLITDTTGEIVVRSFVKQHYSLTGLANLLGARITFNPFITAWELTRLSFVIDWLLNIGNLITLCTAPNFSDQMACVTSVRDQTVKTTYLKDQSSDIQVSSWTMSTPCVQPASYTETYTRNVYSPLRTIVTNSYNRYLFDKPEMRLLVDVNLNWKRILDSLVLAYQPTKSILRSL